MNTLEKNLDSSDSSSGKPPARSLSDVYGLVLRLQVDMKNLQVEHMKEVWSLKDKFANA